MPSRCLIGGLAAGHALVQTTDPAADLFQRLEAREVHVDGRNRHVATAHGVEVRARAGVVDIACRADPPDFLAARIGLLDARFRTVAKARSA